MKNIQVATPTRGFLNHLFNYDKKKLNFVNKTKQYEVVTKNKLILHRLVKSPIFDKIGFIYQISSEIKDPEIDYSFSYNKFLKTNRPYIIYLENPYALVNYSIGRPKTKMGKRNLSKAFNDENLKGIICASESCKQNLKMIYNIPERIHVDQLYPLIPDSDESFQNIMNKKTNEVINCLFIASRFKVKGGYEILELFNLYNKKGINNFRLTLITDVEDLDSSTLENIRNNKNITLYDFTLTHEELNNIYIGNDILLNPTRMDSFSLVSLEALKYGNVIISTNLYALNEMIEEEYNGFLMSPKYRFFNQDNMPNELVWNNRENTILSDYVDRNLVKTMYNKLNFLNDNKKILINMQNNSYVKGNSNSFSSVNIFKKWIKIFNN